MEMTVVGGQVVALSAYAMIVERLADEHGLTPRGVLSRIQKGWASDMLEFFLEECGRAQLPMPMFETLPELLKALWDRYTA